MPEKKRNPHWATQVRMLRYHQVTYDLIGRFETFAQDLAGVSARTGLPREIIEAAGVNNATHAAPDDPLLDDEGVRERIRAVYEADFRAFYPEELPDVPCAATGPGPAAPAGGTGG